MQHLRLHLVQLQLSGWDGRQVLHEACVSGICEMEWELLNVNNSEGLSESLMQHLRLHLVQLQLPGWDGRQVLHEARVSGICLREWEVLNVNNSEGLS